MEGLTVGGIEAARRRREILGIIRRLVVIFALENASVMLAGDRFYEGCGQYPFRKAPNFPGASGAGASQTPTHLYHSILFTFKTEKLEAVPQTP